MMCLWNFFAQILLVITISSSFGVSDAVAGEGRWCTPMGAVFEKFGENDAKGKPEHIHSLKVKCDGFEAAGKMEDKVKMYQVEVEIFSSTVNGKRKTVILKDVTAEDIKQYYLGQYGPLRAKASQALKLAMANKEPDTGDSIGINILSLEVDPSQKITMDDFKLVKKDQSDSKQTSDEAEQDCITEFKKLPSGEKIKFSEKGKVLKLEDEILIQYLKDYKTNFESGSQRYKNRENLRLVKHTLDICKIGRKFSGAQWDQVKAFEAQVLVDKPAVKTTPARKTTDGKKAGGI